MFILPQKVLLAIMKRLHKRYSNDGLTAKERKRLAVRYRNGAGSRHVSEREKELIRAWREHRKNR